MIDKHRYILSNITYLYFHKQNQVPPLELEMIAELFEWFLKNEFVALFGGGLISGYHSLIINLIMYVNNKLVNKFHDI